jgi:hypothetical protein
MTRGVLKSQGYAAARQLEPGLQSDYSGTLGSAVSESLGELCSGSMGKDQL